MFLFFLIWIYGYSSYRKQFGPCAPHAPDLEKICIRWGRSFIQTFWYAVASRPLVWGPYSSRIYVGPPEEMLDTNTLLSRPVVLPRAKTGTFLSIECMLLRKSFPNLHSIQKVVPTPLSQINLELTMPSGCLPVQADFLACCQKFPTTVQDRVPWDLFLTWRKSG